MANTGASARNKGHGYERQVAILLRRFFPLAATTRAQSKLLDNCLIDLCNVPFNIQCKAGYAKNTPKYDVLFAKTRERLDKDIPPGHMLESVRQNPFLLFHKKGGKQQENTVTMTVSTFFDLLGKIYPAVEQTEAVVENEVDEIDEEVDN